MGCGNDLHRPSARLSPFLPTPPAPTSVYNTTNDSHTRDAYIAQLQSERLHIVLPAMILLIFAALVGLVGNSLVLVVYSRKTKKSATRFLVALIAAVDLVTNVVVIPGHAYTQYNRWNFPSDVLCRTVVTSVSYTTTISVWLLLGVAIIRYRKVCHPQGYQPSCGTVKWLCLLMFGVTLLSSLPIAIVTRVEDISTEWTGIYGQNCRISQRYVDPVEPLMAYYFITILVLLIIISTVIVGLYVRIGRHIKKIKRQSFQRPSRSMCFLSSKSDVENKNGICLHVDCVKNDENKTTEVVDVMNKERNTERYLSCSNVNDCSGQKEYQFDNVFLNREVNTPAPKENSHSESLSTTRDIELGIDLREKNLKTQTEKNCVENKYVNTGFPQDRKTKRQNRKTSMLLAISLAFIVPFFPHVFIMVLPWLVPGYE